MKRIMFLTLIFPWVIFSGVNAQGAIEEWPALIIFHTALASIFYPSEKGNLMPLKSRSQELLTKANLLYKSAIPSGYPEAETRKVSRLLLADAKALHRLVLKNRDDLQLNYKLNVLNDRFQQLLAMCEATVP